MGWSEKDYCIKCNKGGKVLVCSENGCPIIVHKKCLGYSTRYGDGGNFYCPYCLYRRATLECQQARENAMSRKKALLTFIDEDVIDCNKEEPKTRKADEKNHSRLEVSGDVNERNSKDGNNGNCEERASGKFTESTSPCGGANSSSPAYEQNRVLTRNVQGQCVESDHCQTSMEHKAESGSIIACGTNDGICGNSEKTEQRFEFLSIRKGPQSENQGQLDKDQPRRTDESHHEISYFSESAETYDAPKFKKRKQKDAGKFEEHGGSSLKEHVQEEVPEDTASSADSMQVNSRIKGGDEVSDSESQSSREVPKAHKCIKRNSKNKRLSSNIKSPSREGQNSPVVSKRLKHFKQIRKNRLGSSSLESTSQEGRDFPVVSKRHKHVRETRGNRLQSPNTDSPSFERQDSSEVSKRHEHVKQNGMNKWKYSTTDSPRRSLRRPFSEGQDSPDISTGHMQIKQNGKNKQQSSDIDSPRRPCSTTANMEQNGNFDASFKLRQLALPSARGCRDPFGGGRRKKLLWREEEEEMLREGVQKYAGTVKKNLPWRKILEFGCRVFDGTRTPSDLKDKWKNMMAKKGATR